MTFKVQVTANARRDRDRVIAWFDENHPDQSDRFIEDYFRTLRRVEEQGTVPAADDHGFRHLAFGTFRYHLWYRIVEDSDVVYVLAVNYQGRDPESLNPRLGLV